jgi:lysophospholipase L1-like esterase
MRSHDTILRPLKQYVLHARRFKNNMNNRKLIWVGYIALIHLALLVVCAAYLVLAKKQPLLSSFQKELRYYLEVSDKTLPNGAIVMLGDSITQSISASAVSLKAVNYGIGGQTAGELAGFIPKLGSIKSASIVVVAIGINDIKRLEGDKLPTRYEKIAALIPEKTPLLWSTIIPASLNPAEKTYLELGNNSIKELCRRRIKCELLENKKLFESDDGQLKTPLFETDLLHLSEDGNLVWINALKDAIKRFN